MSAGMTNVCRYGTMEGGGGGQGMSTSPLPAIVGENCILPD